MQCHPTNTGLHTATLTLSSNDGSHLYNLTCRGIAPPSPFLVPVGSIGNTPAHGLAGAYAVAVAPDGQNVYVTGYTDDDVASFRRDTATGALTFINFNGAFFNYLDGARLIAMSPDNKNGYAAGQNTPAVVQGARNAATGEMTFPNAVSGLGLAGVYGVAVSPDGRNVYATATTSNTAVVFSRNLSTGNLLQIQTLTSSGLIGARGIAVSPDGANVYVTAYPELDARHPRSPETQRGRWQADARPDPQRGGLHRRRLYLPNRAGRA